MGAPGNFASRLLSGLLLAAAAGNAAGADLWAHQSAASELLPVDQAFALVSAEKKRDGIEVTWSIAPGYYLYRKRLGFVALAGGKLGAPSLPQGLTIHDEHEGDAEIYRGILVAVLPLGKDAAAPRQLRVRYQGCAEAGVCYPPQSRVIDVVQNP